MQQFVRRQPGEEGGAARDVIPADNTIAQLLDQIEEVSQQVARLREEVETVRGENDRLRSQLAQLTEGQEVSDPSASPARPTAQAAQVVEAPAQIESKDDELSEDGLVEQLRGFGAAGSDASAKPVEDPPTAPSARSPLSDDEIQKMLAEAALGATDAAKVEQPDVSPVEDEAPEPAVSAEEGPVLRIVADEPTSPLAIEFDLAAVAKVPSHLAIGALAIPVRLDGGTIVCKAVAPIDRESLDMIADATACKVTAEPAQIEDVLAALRKAYGSESDDLEREAAWEAAPQQPRRRGLFRRAA